MSEELGSVAIQRSSASDIKIRDLYVSIDGGRERNIKFGGETIFELEPGEHTLAATNRASTKKESFTVAKGETITFEVGNVAKGCMSALMAFGMAAYSVELTRKVEP